MERVGRNHTESGPPVNARTMQAVWKRWKSVVFCKPSAGTGRSRGSRILGMNHCGYFLVLCLESVILSLLAFTGFAYESSAALEKS